MRIKTLIVAVLLAGIAQTAIATVPSDASIERLLTLTRAESLIDQSYAQMQQTSRQALLSASSGALNEAQQKVVDEVVTQMSQLMREALSWPKLKADMMMLYREAFTQQEVDGMIAFYETPVGQSTINKLPLVMQRSMQLTIARMQPLFPQLQAISEEGARRIKAAAR